MTGVTPGGYTANWSSEGESPAKLSAASLDPNALRDLIRVAQSGKIQGLQPAAPVVATEDPGVLEVLTSVLESDDSDTELARAQLKEALIEAKLQTLDAKKRKKGSGSQKSSRTAGSAGQTSQSLTKRSLKEHDVRVGGQKSVAEKVASAGKVESGVSTSAARTAAD